MSTSAASGIDLTDRQRAVLRAVFARYADRIDWVDVYGSRAMGTARPGSDVDLAIGGEVTEEDLAAIRTDLEESELSIFADVIAIDMVRHAPLKADIARWAKRLFDRTDLVQ